MQRKSAKEVRKHFAQLLDAAENGTATIVTRWGRPIAVLVPIAAYNLVGRQPSLLPLAGTGRGLWTRNSTKAIRKLRDEWERG